MVLNKGTWGPKPRVINIEGTNFEPLTLKPALPPGRRSQGFNKDSTYCWWKTCRWLLGVRVQDTPNNTTNGIYVSPICECLGFIEHGWESRMGNAGLHSGYPSQQHEGNPQISQVNLQEI